jgi:hypothetical protein
MEDQNQTPQPAEQPAEQPIQLGPCEAMFNQMMREIDAQAKRAQLIARPGDPKPQFNLLALLRGVMRGLDGQIGQTFGAVYEEIDALKAENARLRDDLVRAQSDIAIIARRTPVRFG